MTQPSNNCGNDILSGSLSFSIDVSSSTVIVSCTVDPRRRVDSSSRSGELKLS